MEENLTFEELYEAYILCLKNKKRKAGTYSFVNEELCKNLVNELNLKIIVENLYIITQKFCFKMSKK